MYGTLQQRLVYATKFSRLETRYILVNRGTSRQASIQKHQGVFVTSTQNGNCG